MHDDSGRWTTRQPWQRQRGASLAPDRTGSTLGSFSLVQRRGSQRGVETYVAHASDRFGAERVVQLRCPRIGGEQDRSIREALRREAFTGARLQHANVATPDGLHETDDGTLFVTRAYTERVSLRELLQHACLKRDPFPLDMSLSLLVQLCAGVEHIHRGGDAGVRLRHQRLVPESIEVSFEGTAFVDALESVLWPNEASTWRLEDERYVAPERMAGHHTAHSDLFALGKLLETLTVGIATRHDVMALPRPASNFVDALRPLIARATHPSPTERFASARQLQVALEEFATRRKIALSSSVVRRLLKRRLDREAFMRDTRRALKDAHEAARRRLRRPPTPAAPPPAENWDFLSPGLDDLELIDLSLAK